MANEQHFDYDVFISYSHNDEVWVENTLLPKLEANGVSVCIDYRDFAVGKAAVINMQDAAERSRHTLLVLTPAWLASEWTRYESLLVRGEDPAGSQRLTIPLLLEKCDPPKYISMLTWADFTREDRHDSAWKRVFDAVKPNIRPSATPVDTTSSPPENPFIEVRAIQAPERFIGRTAELRRLEQLLSGGSVSLTGEAKIGKSSLLWALKRQWTGMVIGPIDCQQLIDPDDFYEELAEALSLENSRWRTIRNALRAMPALLLLDEMGAAPSRGLEARHMEPFRSLCDQNRDLHIVAASRRPLREIFPTAAGSEFYNIFSPLMLGPLTKTDAEKLLTHPWTGRAPLFDATAIDGLLSLAGIHPFRLQRAAFHCFEALFDPVYDWRGAYHQDVEQML